MSKHIKWFFVVLFLIISILFGFGVLEASNGIAAAWSLVFAYLAYKSEIKVKTE